MGLGTVPIETPTFAAPAARLGRPELERQSSSVATAELLKAVLDASPTITLVLNSHRQIVYYNRALLDVIDIDDPCQVLGKRPGEAVGCIHANKMPGGCGTSEACQVCGALSGILEALSGKPNSREYRVTRVVGGRLEAVEFAVQSRPLTIAGERFAVFSLLDVSQEKRRRALERIFFHDVLNTASCVQGLADVVARLSVDGAAQRTVEMLRSASRQLVHEIANQRTLSAAETNELAIEPGPLSTRELLLQEVERYCGFPVAQDRSLKIDPESADVRILTDRALLGRVLGNMLVNALEASLPGGEVRTGCRECDTGVEFWVHNAGAISREVQLQIFQRCFSTKGVGRGLGAYSMKLLTERYLGGTISFTSSEREGTAFRARYPRILAV